MKITSVTKGTGGVARHVKQVNKTLREVSRKPVVEVGFFKTAKYKDGTPVPAVAAWMEFGVDYKFVRIPSRPFFRTAIQAAKNQVKKHYENVEVLPGIKTLRKVGQTVADEIKRQIARGSWIPNANKTVERKGSKRPLIDTGLLRTSATYEVNKG